jgi:hypothetical protein
MARLTVWGRSQGMKWPAPLTQNGPTASGKPIAHQLLDVVADGYLVDADQHQGRLIDRPIDHLRSRQRPGCP